jgi:Type IV secretion system pilin
MIRRLIFSLAMLVMVLLSSAASVSAVTTNPLNQACQSNNLTRSSAVCKQSQSQGTTNPVSGPKGIINTAANIVALITGGAAVIVIIISGFMFVTAGGAAPGQRSTDPNRLKTARSSLSGAIIGLVIVAFSWILVRFVTDHFVQ